MNRFPPILVCGLLLSGCSAEEHSTPPVVCEHSRTELGVIDLGSAVTQTPKGSMRYVGRIIDAVKRETVDGCHVAYAIMNSPHDFKLHVLVDGRSVAGFDDVIWHSLQTSADGTHFAFVANREGRQVCVRDGAMGQSFEKIGRSGPESGSPLVFSPDGRQLGYAARMDGAWHVVLDGTVGPAFDDVGSMGTMSFRKVPANGPTVWQRYDVGIRDCPQFSADGRHFFYLAQRKKTDRTRYVLVLDGKPGPEYEGFWGAYLCPNGEVAYVGLNGFNAQVVFDGVPEVEQGSSKLLFSADGKRHAYSVGKAGSGVHSVVVDGKQGASFGTIDNLQFSPDGHHVAFNTYGEASGYRVVMDGTLIPPVDGFRISRVYFSGDGERTVFLGEKKRQPVGDNALIENGQVISVFPSSNLLFLSPDCRRVAYIKVTPRRGLWVVVLDGIEHPEMASIDFERVKFSRDSRHFSYVGEDLQQRSRVIVDGVAGPQLDSLAANQPVFSSAGYGWAYAGRLGAEWVVVANGVLGPKLTGVNTESFVFTPDGQGVAYIAKLGGEYAVVRDSVPGPCFAEVRADSLQFSPDGKRLAYIVAETEQKGKDRKIRSWRAVMDGVPGPRYSEIGSKNVVFSSDGKHWAYVACKDREELVVIDGIEGPRFASIEAGPKECRDGRLEYLAFDSDEPRRKLVRITVKGFGTASHE